MQRSWSVLTACVMTVTALAGCAGTGGTAESPDEVAPFALTVEVIGLGDAAGRVAGATVTARDATGPVTQATTSADGVARLALARDTPPFMLHVRASGWVEESSTPLTLQAPSFADALGAIFEGIGCALSFGFACPDDLPVTHLPGDAAHVRLRLVPPTVTQTFDVTVPAHANTAPSPTGESGAWFPVTARFAEDTDAHHLHMTHLAEVEAVLAWTNAPPALADFELGVGCGGDPDAVTDEGPALLGDAERTLRWTPPESRAVTRWGESQEPPCGGVDAGPVTETANTNVAVALTLTATFRGGMHVPEVMPPTRDT